MMNVNNFVGDIKQSFSCADRLEEEIKSLNLKPDFYIDKLLRLAVYYVRAQHYTKARGLSREAEAFAYTHNNLDQGIVYNNLGYLSELLGDRTKAMAYYDQAVKYFNNEEDISYIQLGNTLNNIAIYYQEQGDLEKADQYFYTALKTLNRVPDYNKSQGFLLTNHIFRAINAQKKDDLIGAATILNQGFSIPLLLKSQYHRLWHHQGINYTKQGNTKLALSLLNQALEERLKRFGTKNSYVASSYEAIGDLYLAQGETDSANLYFQKAILSLIKDEVGSYKNPSPDQEIVDKIDLLSPLNKKAKLHIAQGNFEAALASLEAASDFVYAIRRDIFSTESKLQFTAKATEIYEEAIKVCIALHRQSKSEVYLEKMFAFMERNKATLLLESILEAEAQGASKIPESLRNQLSQVKMKKANYEKALLQIDKNKKQVLYQELQGDLLEIDRELMDLNTNLETNHPTYYQLRYQFEVPKIEAIRKEVLKDKELLIEFFQGKDQLYAFVIGPSLTQYFQYPKSAVNKKNLLSFLAYFKDKNQILNAPFQYQEEASALYKALLDPILKAEKKKINRLCIVPDGLLGQLPFEALIKEDGTYLIENYEPRIAYSAALLQTPRKIEEKPYPLLAVAPGFEKGHRGLSPLPFSREEVENIPYQGKRVLLNQEAQLSTFKSFGNQYKVIHLSTHAEANEVRAIPRICFYDEDLLIPDLYALPLNTDLVVLSACETNLGTFAEGEGMLSMARAFSEAGARNLIASYWEVQDKASSEIINQFYTHFKKGSAKATALRQAKLDYLNDPNRTDLTRSPYYWASFTYIANYQEPSRSSLASPALFIGLFLIVLLIGAFFYLK